MKHLLALALFLALFAFCGVTFAQEMGDDDATTEKEDAQPEKDAKPEPEKRPARGDRAGREHDRKSAREMGRVIGEKDTDRDGKLTKDELGDDELFTKLDKDEDGFVTLRELAAEKDAVTASIEKQAAAIMKEEFGILDRDDSGRLSKSELGNDFAPLLETGDADKDGELNLDEFTKARKAKSDDRDGSDRPGADRDIMGALDKDNDGTISKEEAGPRLKENFDKLDTDGDGFITKEELEALKGQRMKRGDRKPEGEDKPKDDTPNEEKKSDDKE